MKGILSRLDKPAVFWVLGGISVMEQGFKGLQNRLDKLE